MRRGRRRLRRSGWWDHEARSVGPEGLGEMLENTSAEVSRTIAGRGRGEPGRCSRAHEGDAYGCCVPALTRFASPHCPGPPRLTLTPASRWRRGPSVEHRDCRGSPPPMQGQDRAGILWAGRGNFRGRDLAVSVRVDDDKFCSEGRDPERPVGVRGRREVASPRRHRPEALPGPAPCTSRIASGDLGGIDVSKHEKGAAMARRLTARPSAGLGGRPPGLRADPGQRLQGAGPASTPRARRGLRPVLPGRLVRRAGGQDGPGALRRAHALQGDRAVPQGADRPPGVRRGRAVERRDRRGLHALLVRLPLRPLGAGPGDRGRPDAGARRSTPARSRPSGTSSARSAPASSTRRSAGSTRPTWPSPTSATPIATRSSAGPTTWRGSPSTTSATSTAPTTAPTAPCW